MIKILRLVLIAVIISLLIGITCWLSSLLIYGYVAIFEQKQVNTCLKSDSSLLINLKQFLTTYFKAGSHSDGLLYIILLLLAYLFLVKINRHRQFK